MSNEERVALLQKQLKATEELAKALMGVREAEANLARLMEHRGEVFCQKFDLTEEMMYQTMFQVLEKGLAK